MSMNALFNEGLSFDRIAKQPTFFDFCKALSGMIQWMNVNVVPPRRSHVPTHARYLLMEVPIQW